MGLLRAWYMASIAARYSVVELGLLPDHLRRSAARVAPSARQALGGHGRTALSLQGCAPERATGRNACAVPAGAGAHAPRVGGAGQVHSPGDSGRRTRGRERGACSRHQACTDREHGSHAGHTRVARLRPRASGSFMMSIMTRFFTAGSAIMSESSCGAQRPRSARKPRGEVL